MLRSIAVFTLILWSSTASAYCPEPTFFFGKSFEAEVNDNFKHLICLHNEQVTSLNQHATEINHLNDLIDGMKNNNTTTTKNPDDEVVRKLISRYGDLATENQFLKYRVDKLEKQLKELIDTDQ